MDEKYRIEIPIEIRETPKSRSLNFFSYRQNNRQKNWTRFANPLNIGHSEITSVPGNCLSVWQFNDDGRTLAFASIGADEKEFNYLFSRAGKRSFAVTVREKERPYYRVETYIICRYCKLRSVAGIRKRSRLRWNNYYSTWHAPR